MKSLLILSILIVAAWSKPTNITNGFKTVSTRLIGGQPSVAGQYPFAAAIYFTTEDNGRYFCGGALINNQWIITSGQCVVNAASFEIHLGSAYLNQADSNRQIFHTQHFEVPPDFDPQYFVADIGLIRLNLPISYTPYIQRILLAYDHIDDGEVVTALGWGQTSDADPNFAEILQNVELAVVPLQECRNYYDPDIINDNMICANGNNNEGLCLGDTGSALLWYNTLTRSTRHVGVASFIKSGDCEGAHPSGYTRLYSHRSWILATAGV